MSQSAQLPIPQDGPRDPSVAIVSYPDYASAQRTVDYLSDNQFPVEHISIIGSDLRLVETVLGRMTTGRAALAGAASGAWFGTFLGVLFMLFSGRAWWLVLLVAVVIGAAWGAIFGAAAHTATGGMRDFVSHRNLAAARYDVTVHPEHEEAARRLLMQMSMRGL